MIRLSVKAKSSKLIVALLLGFKAEEGVCSVKLGVSQRRTKSNSQSTQCSAPWLVHWASCLQTIALEPPAVVFPQRFHHGKKSANCLEGNGGKWPLLKVKQFLEKVNRVLKLYLLVTKVLSCLVVYGCFNVQ